MFRKAEELFKTEPKRGSTTRHFKIKNYFTKTSIISFLFSLKLLFTKIVLVQERVYSQCTTFLTHNFSCALCVISCYALHVIF